MRIIEQTSHFKRDLKREAKGQHRAVLALDFTEIVRALASDESLAQKHRNHALTGEWKDQVGLAWHRVRRVFLQRASR